jgi:HlyD family secretion protein
MNKPIEARERMDIQAVLRMGGSPAAHWMGRREVKWGGAIILALLLIAILWKAGGTTTQVRYVTGPVTRGNLIVIVTATGSVQPTKKVDVSSELSGMVRSVLVDYNSSVTAGQVLAELDTDKLKATVDSSRAKLAAARAKVADAEATLVEKERDLVRKKALTSKEIASQHDLDLAQAARDRAVASLASAHADVGVAEAELRLNETNLAKACICSPISGVVLKRNIDPGQTVAASFQAPVLFSIAEDLKQMELQVDVDEADVGKVRVGQTASFSVDAFPDQKFPATIRDVRYASETIQGVVTYKAVLDIDNSGLLLRPGMTATAEIKVTEIADALLLPNSALRYVPPVADPTASQGFLKRLLPGPPQIRPASQREETGPNRTVWILKKDAPTQARIVVGSSDGKLTEIRGGELAVGDALIVDQTTAKR